MTSFPSDKGGNRLRCVEAQCELVMWRWKVGEGRQGVGLFICISGGLMLVR